MKKSTLLMALAAVAMSASAQYSVDPGIQQVLDKGEKYVVDAVLLDDASIAAFQNAGCTVNDFRVDDATRFLYVWDGTFNAGDSSFPGVDFQVDGYPSLTVGTVGWSGAGFFMDSAAGWDMSKYSADTRLHLAFRSVNIPESVGFIFMDQDGFNKPAKFSVGSAAFNDNGVVMPLVAAFDEGNDWVGIDISFGDLAKVWNGFELSGTKAFKGNILSFLAGGVTGKDLSLDAFYIYSPAGDSAVEVVAADNAAPEYFNLQGVRIANPEKGIFLVRQGASVKKVVVK